LAQGSLTDIDYLDLVFPSNEEIIEAMTSPDKPWDDLHHRSYFLPELRRIEAVTREKLSMAKGKPQQIGMTAEINLIPLYVI
jgi:hypothetical protein